MRAPQVLLNEPQLRNTVWHKNISLQCQLHWKEKTWLLLLGSVPTTGKGRMLNKGKLLHLKIKLYTLPNIS